MKSQRQRYLFLYRIIIFLSSKQIGETHFKHQHGNIFSPTFSVSQNPPQTIYSLTKSIKYATVVQQNHPVQLDGLRFIETRKLSSPPQHNLYEKDQIIFILHYHSPPTQMVTENVYIYFSFYSHCLKIKTMKYTKNSWRK